MVDAGFAVIVIEPSLGVISRADCVIDMGTGASHESGTVRFEGVHADLAAKKNTLTGKYLAKYRRNREESS